MKQKFPIPRLLVTQSAAAEMEHEVIAHSRIETAWGQYGIIDDNMIILNGVLLATEDEVTRRYAHASLGGDRHAQAVRWLEKNFDLMRRHGLYPQGNPRFSYLHKGHSHHELGVGNYSGTDISSIREAIEVDNLEYAIGTLGTLQLSRFQTTPGRHPNILQLSQSTVVRLKFYFYSQAMFAAGVRNPIVILPELVQANEVPVMPPVGWKYVREDIYLEQLRHLRHHQCNVTVLEREITNGPPYEIQFLVTKPKWRGRLSIITDWDFPGTPPQFSILPNPGHSADTRPLTEPFEGEDWQEGFDFIDLILRLEAKKLL